MTLLPVLTASPFIQIHICAALTALILGPAVLYRRRRDRLHRRLGYVWVGTMAILALSSFAIPSHFTSFGLGPLHGFAVWTLWSLWAGVRHAIRRNREAHEAVFRSLYTNGLLVAGAFTFLPGRTVNRTVFGEASDWGWAVIVAVLIVVLIRVLASRSPRRVQMG